MPDRQQSVDAAVLAAAAEIARNTIRRMADDRAAVDDVLHGHLTRRGARTAAAELERTDQTAEVDAVLATLRDLGEFLTARIDQFGVRRGFEQVMAQAAVDRLADQQPPTGS